MLRRWHEPLALPPSHTDVILAALATRILQSSRSLIARTLAPASGGKNPDLVFYAMDAHTGTADPAFAAHAAPLRSWASAWWEAWVPARAIEVSFAAARDKISNCKGPAWCAVNGPATALIVTIERIGWTALSARSFVDDLGQGFDALLDPPCAFVSAAYRSVRRWRLSRIAANVPGLIDDSLDAGASIATAVSGTTIIDFPHVVASFVKSSKACTKFAPEWRRHHGPFLLSAISGGQWTQSRRAAVPGWGTGDTCQLCHEAKGTAAHRFVCKITVPDGGWPPPPSKAAKVVSVLSGQRKSALQLKSLLALRVPRPPRSTDGWFNWLRAVPPHICFDETIWYIDGSLLDGRWRELCATGFAVVVTSIKGRLLGFGHGAPPDWVRSAAAAEAWALAFVVSANPFVPQIRTDCQNLVTTAAAGIASATLSSRPLARIWNKIGVALEGNTGLLLEARCLRWIPAHLTAASIGKELPDGECFTAP